MTTCNYCGASIQTGLDTCPHCGGDLTGGPRHEIKIETRPPFNLTATFKTGYTVRRGWKAFVLLPFIVVPGILYTELYMLTNKKGFSALPPKMQTVFGGLILLSIPLTFFLLIFALRRRVRKIQCTVRENEIECMIGGTNRVFLMDQVASVDCLQTDLQSKYETGDVRIVLKNVGYVVFRNIDDYTDAGNRVKKYVSIYQNEHQPNK